jgi:hypothetical protein
MYVSLESSFFCFQKPIQMHVISSSWSDLWFHRLRSVTFTFESKSITQLQRVYIINKILDVSPRLSHLVVAWDDFRYCSRTNMNVKHAHLVLHVHYDDPNPHIDISRLFLLVPGVCCLETSGGHIWLNQNLVKFVLKIIDTFQQLAELTLNKGGIYPFKPEINLAIEQAILTAGNKRLLDSNTYQIIFPKGDKLRIWL